MQTQLHQAEQINYTIFLTEVNAYEKNSTTSTTRHYSYKKRIGSTVYKVNVVIPTEGSETMEEKILRMIRNESSATGPECGIMSVPQVSRPA